MSYWYHCNKCFVMGSNNMKFCFSSCGHLICVNCAKSNGVQLGRKAPCMICHKNSQFVEISRSMNPDILLLFRPQKEIFAEMVQKAKSVAAFQNAHAQHLIKHSVEKSDKAVKYIRSATAEIDKLVKNGQSLLMETDEIKTDMEKTQEYCRQMEITVAEHTKEIQRIRLTQQAQAQHTPPNFRHSREYASLNGVTPLNQLSFRECVTSTPFDRFAKVKGTPHPAQSDHSWFDTPEARRQEHLSAGGQGFYDAPSTPALLMGSQTNSSTLMKDSYNYF